MGKHHPPRPRGYDPGGFRFPGSGWFGDRLNGTRLDGPRGVTFANQLATRAAPAPSAARAVAPRALEQRRHGVFVREPRGCFRLWHETYTKRAARAAKAAA